MSLVLYCLQVEYHFLLPADFRFLSEHCSCKYTYCHVVVSTKAAVVVYSLCVYTSVTVGLSRGGVS
jgi:hypothetical protein